MSTTGAHTAADNGTSPTSPAHHSSTASDNSTINNTSDSAHNSTGTVVPSTDGGTHPGIPGGVIALLLGLLVLGVSTLILVWYLKRTGRLYSLVPFKRLQSRYRRSSTSSSHRALDDDDDNTAGGGGDDTPRVLAVNLNGTQGGSPRVRRDDRLPETREGNMFTIDDLDTETVDLEPDTQSHGTNDDYYYDEVFGKSMFEDEATNASMRHLYLASEHEEDEDDMFDVDAIVSSITGAKATSTKT